jgi:acyl-CoA reductase-like NAD-dependent aldehyde dehydrogenase
MTVTVAEIADTITRARNAQQSWAESELRSRLAIIARLRREIARNASLLLDSFPPEPDRSRAERLAAELVPLAEACRFLEKQAGPILAPRRLVSKRPPFWLRGIEIEERRDSIGVVLIIGPANYPLFLAAVQALQAIVAGNSVIIKPGRGGGPVISAFAHLTHRAGLPEDLLLVLDEDADCARAAIAGGVDKVLLTGSVESGRAVYRQASESLTPVILELSGCDPVFILAGANLQRAADAVAFGVRWNGGNTCIAPRRIFVASAVAEAFERLFWERHPQTAALLPLTRFESEEQALHQAAQSKFALGASIFGPPRAARGLASKVRAGFVVINDMIVPSADPRISFGGRGESGFGVTRGAEGLQQVTALKVVAVQRRSRLRHLEPLPENAEELFAAYLNFSHAVGMTSRLRACGRLFNALTTKPRAARRAT